MTTTRVQESCNAADPRQVLVPFEVHRQPCSIWSVKAETCCRTPLFGVVAIGRSERHYGLGEVRRQCGAISLREPDPACSSHQTLPGRSLTHDGLPATRNE